MLLTGLPGNYFPEVVSFWDWISPDKLVHLLMFGVLSFLLLWGNRTQFSGRQKRYLTATAILTGMAFGALTEVLQAYVFVGRDGNRYDFLANVAGTLLGYGLFWLWNKKNVRTKTPGQKNV